MRSIATAGATSGTERAGGCWEGENIHAHRCHRVRVHKPTASQNTFLRGTVHTARRKELWPQVADGKSRDHLAAGTHVFHMRRLRSGDVFLKH